MTDSMAFFFFKLCYGIIKSNDELKDKKFKYLFFILNENQGDHELNKKI